MLKVQKRRTLFGPASPLPVNTPWERTVEQKKAQEEAAKAERAAKLEESKAALKEDVSKLKEDLGAIKDVVAE